MEYTAIEFVDGVFKEIEAIYASECCNKYLKGISTGDADGHVMMRNNKKITAVI